MQNYAARLVVRCDRRDHITPILKKLHWLPVKHRVTYNIILLTFRALNGLAPIYIVDMLHRHRPTLALRSANNNDLQVPPTSSRYGDRTFAASAPRLWNALPRELKIATSLISFKILLKHTFSALPTNNRLLQCGTTHGTETYHHLNVLIYTFYMYYFNDF